jgi:hypothetical protein
VLVNPHQDADQMGGASVGDDERALPVTTRHDTDAGWGERPSNNDDWLLEERPPHWS